MLFRCNIVGVQGLKDNAPQGHSLTLVTRSSTNLQPLIPDNKSIFMRWAEEYNAMWWNQNCSAMVLFREVGLFFCWDQSGIQEAAISKFCWAHRQQACRNRNCLLVHKAKAVEGYFKEYTGRKKAANFNSWRPHKPACVLLSGSKFCRETQLILNTCWFAANNKEIWLLWKCFCSVSCRIQDIAF